MRQAYEWWHAIASCTACGALLGRFTSIGDCSHSLPARKTDRRVGLVLSSGTS